jgi:hypothetical protein
MCAETEEDKARARQVRNGRLDDAQELVRIAAEIGKESALDDQEELLIARAAQLLVMLLQAQRLVGVDP